MKRICLLLTLSIFVINCAGNNSVFEKQFVLEDGQKILVTLEEKEIENDEKVLVANYKVEERILKHETVDKHVFEIWKNLEKTANKKNLTEGIIAAKYFVGKDEKTDEPVYEDFLYESEKIENGTWKIRKVN